VSEPWSQAENVVVMDEVIPEVDRKSIVIGIEVLYLLIAAACSHMRDMGHPRKMWTLVVAKTAVYLNTMTHSCLILAML
jgi:hypothetical protein